MSVTVDLQTKNKSGFWALLVTPAGSFDVYGSTLKEIRNEAQSIANELGVKIEIFNLELPEG